MNDMNATLIKLVQKYEDRAERVKEKSFAAAEFYRQAAKRVLALAMQS